MFALTIVAVILMALIISYKANKTAAETLGISCIGAIFLLYVLAFLNKMHIVDYLAALVILGAVGWIALNDLFVEVAKKLFTVKNLCVFVMLSLLALSQILRISSAWDDLNYWATDAKALYYLDGFAGKYGNVASEFGSRPPAVQLFKWFFLHMSPTYMEGLAFAGISCLNFILLLPLIGKLSARRLFPDLNIEDDSEVGVRVKKNKKYKFKYDSLRLKSKFVVQVNDSDVRSEDSFSFKYFCLDIIVHIIAFAGLIILQGVALSSGFEGTGADVTTGIVYGLLLWSMWQRDEDCVWFYYLRIAMYGCMLILSHSAGFAWVLLSLIWFAMCLKRDMAYDEIRELLIVVGSWAVTFMSWLIFCLVNRRISKMASAAFYLIKSKNADPGAFVKEKAILFIEGMIQHPMHTDHTWLIDLPAIAVLWIFVVLIIIVAKKDMIEKSEENKLILFTCLSAILCYAVLFLGHISVLAQETQYSEGQVMAISIANYGAPFVIGTIVLLIGIAGDGCNKGAEYSAMIENNVLIQAKKNAGKYCRKTYLIILILLITNCNYIAVYNGMWGYMINRQEANAVRKGMIDENERLFISETQKWSGVQGQRVMYIRDRESEQWVHNPYISYEASPVSVVYGSVTPDMTPDDVIEMIRESHANYVYVDDLGVDFLSIFLCISAEDFEYERMYRIYLENE